MFGLRFEMAPCDSHGGAEPTAPPSAWIDASAFGHGHCAVKATYWPSGVDV